MAKVGGEAIVVRGLAPVVHSVPMRVFGIGVMVCMESSKRHQ